MSLTVAPQFSQNLSTSMGPQRGDTTLALGCIAPIVSDGYFAFARVQGDVRLVQVSLATPTSALTTVDAKIFRHEFITIFRLSETKAFHPTDISIIEPISDYHVRYEEENETVFLARELTDRLRKMTERAPRISHARTYRYSTQFAPRSART